MENVQQLELQVSASKIVKICRIICLALLCLLSITPLLGIFVPPGVFRDVWKFKIDFIKIVGFILLVVGFLSILANSLIFGRKYLLGITIKNPWNILFFIVIVWSIISFSQTRDFDTSLNGYAYAYEGFLAYIAYWGIYLGASNLKGDKYKTILLRVIVCTAGILAFFSFLRQIVGIECIFAHAFRVGFCGTFLNSNHYGYYLCLTSILALGMFYYSKDKIWKPIYGVIYYLNLTIHLLNDSFGSFIAYFFGLVLFVIFALIRKEKDKKQCFFLLFVAVSSLAMCSALNRNMFAVELPGFFKDIGSVLHIASSESGMSAIDDIGGADLITASTRNQLWADAIKLIEAKPIFGWGIDSVPQLFRNYFHIVDAPHNEYLSLAVGIGIPGTVALVAGVLFILIKSIVKVRKIPQIPLICAFGVGVYFISSMFGISLPAVELFYFAVLGMLNSYYNERYQVIDFGK